MGEIVRFGFYQVAARGKNVLWVSRFLVFTKHEKKYMTAISLAFASDFN